MSENFQIWKDYQIAPRQILLVEDSAHDIAIILKMSIGYNVQWVVARDFKTAADLLKDCQTKRQFSLIVLDLNLNSTPTGEDLYSHIKECCPFIPIVVFSGYFTTAQAISMAAKGFVTFTIKPTSYTPEFFEQMFAAFNIPKRIQMENPMI